MSQLAGYAGRAVTLADLEPRSTSAPLGERRPTVIEPAAIPSTLLKYDGNEESRSDAYGKFAATIFPDVDPKNTGRDLQRSLKKQKKTRRPAQTTLPIGSVASEASNARGAGKALSRKFEDAMSIADQRDPRDKSIERRSAAGAQGPRRPEAARDYSARSPSLMPLLSGRNPPKQRRTPLQHNHVTSQCGHAKDDLGLRVRAEVTDQVCSELVSQVTVGCLEHGGWSCARSGSGASSIASAACIRMPCSSSQA